MPTRTFLADRSSLLAVSGSTELGGGQDDHLPIGGPWNGYTFRGVVRFALDYSTMKQINSATLRVRTSDQEHIGFSSSPDIYVQRATSAWTPNSASSSGEGGSGWSTSPVVYPGPSSTQTGQATKRMPTTEGTTVDIDLTAIVRAWAPASVIGGGGLTNYGVLLKQVTSGDISEIYSMHIGTAGARPQIIVDYSTDTAPTATATGPTGTGTGLRPTITGTATDPDGDPIATFDIEVKKAAAVVYTRAAVAAGTGGTLSHVPTADLPPGALTVHIRATAAGLTGAYSPDLAFTIDRPPVMGAWSAPAASVAGTRRPVHTIAWSDADGDAGQAYDIEVYPASGGAPVSGSSPVYARSGVTTGLGAGTLSHTPAADLPGGALVARARVQTAGVYSAWSTYRAYTVVLTVPTLLWTFPEYDGGWGRVRTSEMASATYPPGDVDNLAMQGCSFDYAPPSGTTIVAGTSTIKVEVEDPGVGGPAVGTVLVNSGFGAVAGGGTYTYAFRPRSTLAGWLSGTLKVTVVLTCANGATITDVRRSRFALGEWYGAMALGDSVTGLVATPVGKVDDSQAWYRAQTSPTAAAPGAAWTSALATAAGQLPAVNAYLGIYERLSRRADDTQVLVNPSFEAGLAPWGPNFGNVPGIISVVADGAAPDGGSVLQIAGNGSVGYPSALQTVPGTGLIPGATYKVSGYVRISGGTRPASLYLVALDPAGVVIGTVASVITNTASPTFVYGEAWYTFPADGSHGSIRVYCQLGGGTPVVADSARFDRLYLHGPVPGDQGLERMTLAWSSLG